MLLTRISSTVRSRRTCQCSGTSPNHSTPEGLRGTLGFRPRVTAWLMTACICSFSKNRVTYIPCQTKVCLHLPGAGGAFVVPLLLGQSWWGALRKLRVLLATGTGVLYALCSMLLGLGQSRLVVSHDPWVNGNVAYLSAAGIALARALRQAQLCLRDCRWASGAGLAPRLAGNRRLATVLALAKQLGPLSLFLSVAPPVLPALRGPVPGLFVLPGRFPRGFGVLGPGGRRSLPVTFGFRLGKFLLGAFGLLGSCAWSAGYREGVLE